MSFPISCFLLLAFGGVNSVPALGHDVEQSNLIIQYVVAAQDGICYMWCFFSSSKRTYFQAVQKRLLGPSVLKVLLYLTAALHTSFSLKSSGQLAYF
jgi:hypothetical protein